MKTFAKLCLIPLCIFLLYDHCTAATCTVSATSIIFSDYDVFSTLPNDSTGSINMTCDQTQPNIVVSIGASTNSGVFNPRQMKHSSGTDRLNYNIYTSAGASTVWGNGTQGTSTVSAMVKKKDIPATVIFYGRIPAGQDISAGFYSDVLMVTITW